MENERRWLSFELGPVAGQGRLHSEVQQGAWPRENPVSAWHPSEIEKAAHQKMMTGLVNLMAPSEPVFEYRQGFSFISKKELLSDGNAVWFDEWSDITFEGWDLATRPDWSVYYLVKDKELLRPEEFRSMYLQEYTPPEPCPLCRAGIGHTTDRKGDYRGSKRKWDRF